MILIKRGPFQDIDTLEDGRLFYASDKKDLFIGSSGTNIKLSDNTKIFHAKISQLGTGAPTLETKYTDFLPGTIVWSRDSTGEYRGTLANAFDDNTYVEIINLESTSVSVMKGGVTNSSNIYITQRNPSATLIDTTGGFIIKIYKLIPLS
ncbi:hypothetical protein BH10BAC5_BH10BAC5_05950 [soil metagenome]